MTAVNKIFPTNILAFMLRRILTTGLVCVLIPGPLARIIRSQNERTSPTRHARVTVFYRPGNPANRFVPSDTVGAAIDGNQKGVLDLQLTPGNVQEMLTAGFKPLTYRLRTELANEVWHWNPKGSWSDATQHQGYWVSDNEGGAPILLSNGYRLPRRGNTIDQANDDGYSRIDDGDPQSFWKSNPYLSQHFTGEPDRLHPQWVVIEFAKPVLINAVRLVWGQPFAKTYRVQYGNFDDVSQIAVSPTGTWRDFPFGEFPGHRRVMTTGAGDTPLRISNRPIKLRWLRILMADSSGTSESNDVRDRVGFTLREVYAGLMDPKGNFHDEIQHAADRHKQTIIHTSSTDPWHCESDLDSDVEQIGLDRIFQTGLTNGRPMLTPTGLLFDTPENAANEIRYLRARGYKFDQVELGEEPDGQYITPEDFGALYLQWAEAIHRVDASLKLGGPSLQEILYDKDEPASGNSEWMRRFLQYLKRRNHLRDYSFFSFEWYPFDEVCDPVAPQLAQAPILMEAALRAMQRNGLSQRIPWIISEYGYSAFASRAEIDIEGALLNADIIGKFLTLGGDQAFLFGYTPGYVNRDSPCTAGNNMLFSMGDDGAIAHRFATYFGARLLTQEWLQPRDQLYEIYPARSDARNAQNEELVTAYAVKRPDGLWSLLLINKDPAQAVEVQTEFSSSVAGRHGEFEGRMDIFQYSPEQYRLGGTDLEPYPVKAEDPAHRTVDILSGEAPKISLPPYSLTVVRGVVGNLK